MVVTLTVTLIGLLPALLGWRAGGEATPNRTTVPRVAVEILEEDAVVSDWANIPIPLLGTIGEAELDLGRQDMFGNDVSEAVATYKVDAAGTLYEEHAPDTEVPLLASPTT